MNNENIYNIFFIFSIVFKISSFFYKKINKIYNQILINYEFSRNYYVFVVVTVQP